MSRDDLDTPVKASVSRFAPPEWARRTERGSLFLLRFMVWLSLTLGRRISRGVVYGISVYFLLTAPKPRAASRLFLARALGRAPTIADLFRLYHAFASTIHDRVYFLRGRVDEFDVRLQGVEAVSALYRENKGVLLLGAHLGSFEVLRAVGHQMPDLKVCLAMYPDNARRIQSVFATLNPEGVHEIVPLGRLDAILTLKARLEDGAFVGVLADRAVRGDQDQVVDFLGSPAPMPLGPFRMATMLRCPVFFACGLYRGGRRYEVHFVPLTETSSAEALMKSYVRTLASFARSAPYNWFNFYDFWKSDHAKNG